MVYQFHDYVLHVDRRELWRGKQGIAIEPKVFQVLLYLVENRGRVITKAELLDHCWPDTFVSESALTRCLTRLRKALQGVSPQPVIKTLPRQGYRFVAEVIVQPHDTEFHTSYPQPVLAASLLAHSSVPVAPPTPLDTPQMSEPTRHDFEAAPERTPLSPVAERRQLTVMFCDVVEAASLAGQLDPEDYRDVMLRYQATCTAIIERYDGHIAQYLGNGLLVYFGYPMAHEDDAQRAGHTGLSIVDAMERLNLQLEREYGIRLAVRIGIHTGLVVVGEMGGGPQHGSLALGAVPNLAAQIQGLASPNGVLMSALTKALAEGYFVWQPAGAHAVSGMSEPVPLYQALQASGAQHRFDTAHPGALTPLVGRELELGLLLERWGHVREGDGHVVILSGEAGIGKSRLVLAVKSHIADRAVVLECRCSPYHQNTAFHPLIEMLRRLLNWQDGQMAASHQQQLEDFVAQYGLPPTESMQLLARLLDISLTEAYYPPLMLSPQHERQKVLELLVTFVIEQATHQPVVFIVEDLHWVDPSTLEFLDLLIDQGPMLPVLTVLTCRHSFQLPWGLRAHITPLALNSLSQPQVAAMVTGIAGGKALPTETVQQIIAKADGVPLFVEELTKTVVESAWMEAGMAGDTQRVAHASLAIPTTLQDSLMARLDRLEYGKAVAQLAATIGRQFSYEVLQAVASWEGAMLDEGLRQLVAADLCYQLGIPPQSTYLFKHVLIQEAAYQSLLKRTRQQYHQHIAQVLERQFAGMGATQPELLAHHYTEANLPEQAVVYWRQAGQQALERSANQEAVAHFEHALAVLQQLPETEPTAEQRLNIRLALRMALQALGKQEELLANLLEAEKLAQILGDAQRLGQLYGYMTNYYTWRGDFVRAVATGQQALTLAQAAEHADAQVAAKFNLSLAHYCLGNYPQAMALCRALIDELVGERLYSFAGLTIVQSANARAVLLYCFAEQGDFAEGHPYDEEMCHIAESSQHAATLMRVYFGSARFYLRKGALDIARTRLERALESCEVYNIRRWWPTVAAHLGYALARTGHLDGGLSLLEEAISRAASAQHMLFYTPAVIYMSEAYLLADRVDEAQIYAARALELTQAHKERGHQAWAWWVQGEVDARAGRASTEQIAAWYQQAFARAEELRMRPLQAHCHLGLGMMYRRHGQSETARRELSMARELYQAMDMAFWSGQAEAALARL